MVLIPPLPTSLLRDASLAVVTLQTRKPLRAFNPAMPQTRRPRHPPYKNRHVFHASYLEPSILLSPNSSLAVSSN